MEEERKENGYKKALQLHENWQRRVEGLDDSDPAVQATKACMFDLELIFHLTIERKSKKNH